MTFSFPITTLSFDIAALEVYLPLIVGARLVIAGQDVISDGESITAESRGYCARL